MLREPLRLLVKTIFIMLEKLKLLWYFLAERTGMGDHTLQRLGGLLQEKINLLDSMGVFILEKSNKLFHLLPHGQSIRTLLLQTLTLPLHLLDTVGHFLLKKSNQLFHLLVQKAGLGDQATIGGMLQEPLRLLVKTIFIMLEKLKQLCYFLVERSGMGNHTLQRLGSLLREKINHLDSMGVFILEQSNKLFHLLPHGQSIRTLLLRTITLPLHLLDTVGHFLLKKSNQLFHLVQKAGLGDQATIGGMVQRPLNLLVNTSFNMVEKLKQLCYFLVEKSGMGDHYTLQRFGGLLREKINNLDSMGVFILEQSNKLFHLLPHRLVAIYGFLFEKSRPPFSFFSHKLEQVFRVLVEKMDEVFPAETRSQVLLFASTTVRPVVLVLVCLFLCYHCSVVLTAAGMMLKAAMLIARAICYLCKAALTVAGKLMTALGKTVTLIARAIFCCGNKGALTAAGKMMKAPGKAGELILRPVFENDPKAYFLNLRAKPSGSALGVSGWCGLILGLGAIIMFFLWK